MLAGAKLNKIDNISESTVDFDGLYVWKAGFYLTVIVRKSSDGKSLISADAIEPEEWPFDKDLPGVLYGPFNLEDVSPDKIIPEISR